MIGILQDKIYCTRMHSQQTSVKSIELAFAIFCHTRSIFGVQEFGAKAICHTPK